MTNESQVYALRAILENLADWAKAEAEKSQSSPPDASTGEGIEEMPGPSRTDSASSSETTKKKRKKTKAPKPRVAPVYSSHEEWHRT